MPIKNSNIQGRSPNVVTVISHTIRNCPLREVPILKRDPIEENNYLIQLSPFDVRNLFRVLATPNVGVHLVKHVLL